VGISYFSTDQIKIIRQLDYFKGGLCFRCSLDPEGCLPELPPLHLDGMCMVVTLCPRGAMCIATCKCWMPLGKKLKDIPEEPLMPHLCLHLECAPPPLASSGSFLHHLVVWCHWWRLCQISCLQKLFGMASGSYLVSCFKKSTLEVHCFLKVEVNEFWRAGWHPEAGGVSWF